VEFADLPVTNRLLQISDRHAEGRRSHENSPGQRQTVGLLTSALWSKRVMTAEGGEEALRCGKNETGSHPQQAAEGQRPWLTRLKHNRDTARIPVVALNGLSGKKPAAADRCRDSALKKFCDHRKGAQPATKNSRRHHLPH
jgi:hypothetical protein